jgi:hypothetical protein
MDTFTPRMGNTIRADVEINLQSIAKTQEKSIQATPPASDVA